jgi:hypothetical protein
LLDERSRAEDLVLAEVVMDALHAIGDQRPSLRRRRRTAIAPVRRQIVVRDAEAEEIQALADKHSLTASALIRWALELHLD